MENVVIIDILGVTCCSCGFYTMNDTVYFNDKWKVVETPELDVFFGPPYPEDPPTQIPL